MPQKHSTAKPMASAASIGSRCACHNLRRASRLLTRFYDGFLAPSGLRSTQFSILAATDARGPLPISRLADSLAVERTTLTRNLALLETKGLVAFGSGQDRREHAVSITTAGRAALASALPYWDQAQAAIAQRLGPERLERILNDMAVLAEAVRA